MPPSSNRFASSPRSVITVAAIVAALFVTANLTAKNSSHPGTVSNIAFVASVLGAVLLAVIATAALIQRRRRRQR